MARLKKKVKYDIIIYGCLFTALILIGSTGYSYFSDTSYSIKDIFSEKEEEPELEPQELTKVDKKTLLLNYINDLLDEKITDEVLTYEILHSWESYEILDINYDREITTNYYAYLVNIKINNTNALIPTSKNKELSNDKYLVISLNINILKDETTNEYIVKSIDIPKNS